MEQIPDPFAAEQAEITEEEIKAAQQRKGSYEEMDQQMDETQINSSTINSVFSKLESTKPKTDDKLTDMFENMQITVVGRENQADNNSDFVSSGNESEDGLDEDEHFKEDPNLISLKH